MTIDPGPNDPCPCGKLKNGKPKKFKYCCMKKKARKWAFKVEFKEPITHLGIGSLADGTMAYFSNGVLVEPKKVEYETHYDREKKNKVINRMETDPNQISSEPDQIIKKFNLIYAIDTNTKTINGKDISATVVMLCKLTPTTDDVVKVEYGHLRSIEFWNMKDHPENIAWMKIIQFIINDVNYDPESKIGIVIDSDLGNLPAYNARSAPIYDDFYLPKNFELIYASAETDTEQYLVNHLIGICEFLAKGLLIRISQNEERNYPMEEVNNEPYTHIKFWEFNMAALLENGEA